MKAKSIKKVIESAKEKKQKKAYSTSEIREAIAYWKGRLASLNESDEEPDETPDEEDVDDGDSGVGGIPDEDKVEDKAKASPVGAFNPTKRFYRMHLHAEKVVKQKLAKLLHSKGLKEIEDSNIVIENSAIDDGDFDTTVDNILVTVKVSIDKAQLKGFRKFLAVLKEEDGGAAMGEIDEGLLSALFKGLADTAKGVKKAADEKVAAANEKLKQTVGVAAMQEYFNAFFGKILAKKVTLKNVFAGADEPNTVGAQFIYCASVTLKH